jgi:hypothetical protein
MLHAGVGAGGSTLSGAETAAYEVLHGTGYITIGREEYAKELKKNPARAIEDQKTAASSLAKEGKSKTELLALGFNTEALAGAALSEEAAAADLKERLWTTKNSYKVGLSKKLGRFGKGLLALDKGLDQSALGGLLHTVTGTLGLDGEQALMEELQRGGGTMDAFQMLIEGTLKGDATKTEAALKLIEDGKNPAAYQAAVAISKDRGAAERWRQGLGKGGIAESNDDLARATLIKGMQGSERHGMLSRQGKADEYGIDTKKFFAGLQGGNKRDRSIAYGDALLALTRGGKDGQKITASEMEYLERLTGGTGKTLGLTNDIESFAGGKSDKALMEKYGFTASELGAARGDKEGSRAGLIRLMTQKGLTDAAVHGAVDETSVQGISTKYIEANTAFVTAVSIFTHAIAASKIGQEAGLGDVVGGLSDARNNIPGMR